MTVPKKRGCNRRTILKGLSATAFSSALAALLPSPGCIDPGLMRQNGLGSEDETRSKLRTFIATVIPGIHLDDMGTEEVFYDPDLPLAAWRDVFVEALDAAAGRGASDLFLEIDEDSLDARVEAIQRGLASRVPGVSRLFRSFIFGTQLAGYCGTYDDEFGSPLLDFPGATDGRRVPSEVWHDDELERLLAGLHVRSATADGNPD